MMTDPVGIAHVLHSQHEKKTIVPIFLGGTTIGAGIQTLIEGGMVNFDSPSDMINALDALAQRSVKEKDTTPSPRLSKNLSMLGLEEMQSILSEYNLTLEGAFVKNEEAIESALETLGSGPYAIKAISSELVHKSDLQAVSLNLHDPTEIRSAWEHITHRVEEHTSGAVIDGMLIQKMRKGVECIIGMKRDPIFGPTIVFGLGGIFVEILKDSSMRIAPVSHEEALRAIEEIQGISLLTGARGTDPVDLQALANVITALSELALKRPDIEEIDFNPVFATPHGAYIVDARLMVS
jgi:acetyltransferase